MDYQEQVKDKINKLKKRFPYPDFEVWIYNEEIAVALEDVQFLVGRYNDEDGLDHQATIHFDEVL